MILIGTEDIETFRINLLQLPDVLSDNLVSCQLYHYDKNFAAVVPNILNSYPHVMRLPNNYTLAPIGSNRSLVMVIEGDLI